MSDLTPKHDQVIRNGYIVHYPEHEPREGDPHYKDFHAFKKAHPDARCEVGLHRNDFSECDETKPVELHHRHVEFAVANMVDLKWLAVDYPGVDDPDEVGAWVESGDNFVFLCPRHHRAADLGVHHLAAADWEAIKYVRGLTSKLEK